MVASGGFRSPIAISVCWCGRTILIHVGSWFASNFIKKIEIDKEQLYDRFGPRLCENSLNLAQCLL